MTKKKKPKKELTGLAAALVKAGRIDEKKARKLTREQRREEKALGREGVARQQEEKEAEAAARRTEEAERSRERERGREATETHRRALRTIRDSLDPGYRGRRRWFFVARDGRVPFLDVSDQAARMLAEGQAGIVESLGESADEHVVITSERALVTLLGIDRELVRFWNRGESGGR